MEVRYEAKLPGADDVVKLLRDKWPAGLAQSRPEYLAALRSTAPLAVDSLGDAVSMRSMADGSSLAVHRTSLCSAHQTVKVGDLASLAMYSGEFEVYLSLSIFRVDSDLSI